MPLHKKKMASLVFSLLLGVVLFSNAVLVNAADGDLDPSFTGTGANVDVFAIAVQADGKIIIGGRFFRYNGVIRRQIARLNADGTLDTTFDPGTGPDGTVSTIIAQADGKIVINGGFTSYNGTSRKQIARLNSDGTLDTTFDPGQFIDGNVYTISLLPNGKYILGGAFPLSPNSTLHNFVMRINADGTPDNTFISGGNESVGAVTEIALQSSGKIIIGGQFGIYNNTSSNSLARLNSDGTLDTTFHSGAEGSTQLYTISIQSDDKIIIGGQFQSYGGVQRHHIARVNSDGTLDTTFNPGLGANDTIFTTALQPDGKIIIGGIFTTFDGASRKNIARLNADGSLDTTFNVGTGLSHTKFQSAVLATVLQADGKLLIGGFFDSYNGTIVNNIARLLTQPGALSFSASSYNVVEGAGSVSITVTRAGDLSTAATVDYETVAGTATDKGDYNTARGTLRFAAGQTSASFVVIINEDAYQEVPESFQVRLSNATVGVGLGNPNTATVTITDNDTAPPTANPTDNIDDFVRQLYHDFLDREPEAEGFNYWTNILRGCPDDECLNRVRVEIASRFFQELEFQQTGYFVMRLYKAAYGRFPTYQEFVADRRQVGQSVESQRAFAGEFVKRPSFTGIYGTLSDTDFVNLLFDTANLKPYTSERQAQVSLLQGGKSRAQVLVDLVEINEFRTREFNAAFVRMMYFGFLRRDVEPQGEAYWLNVIDNVTPNNYQGMICGFLNSLEYQQRFSSVRGRFTELSCH